MTEGEYPSTFDLMPLRCFVAVAEELRHTILSLVGTGLGLALVPACAARLNFDAAVSGHWLKGTAGMAELYLGWKRNTDDPLLPIVAGLARDLVESMQNAH